MVVIAALAYPAWLGMLALHELGHVLHARLSGGVTEHVTIPLFGFSQTLLSHNPHPLFVAVGGAIWGVLLPLLASIVISRIAHLSRGVKRPWITRVAWGFAGFCSIANGAYLAAGSWFESTDAADLVRLGAPRALLVLAGAGAAAIGLAIWHRLTIRKKAGGAISGGGDTPVRPHL